MKYVIVRCEDHARPSAQAATLLEGAKTAHLQHLAQAGAGGLICAHRDRRAIDRVALHRGLIGLTPHDPEASPGHWYAASAKVPVGADETVWCCELVTQQDGKILDQTVDEIPTKESGALIDALNRQLSSETRRWECGDGAHHLLVSREATLAERDIFAVPSPDTLAGQSWERALPRGATGEALRQLILETSKLLESQPVNRVRVDLGENPANLVWLWGPAQHLQQRTWAERTGHSGAIVSSCFPLRGFAQILGLEWKEATTSIEESAFERLTKTISVLSARHEIVYVHLRVRTSNPVERLCFMERLDQLLLKPLTEHLPTCGPWRLLLAIDDLMSASVPVVAIGSGLPQQPIAQLTSQNFTESPLTFADGEAVFAWLTQGQVAEKDVKRARPGVEASDVANAPTG